MGKVSFGIIGYGWRARFFLKVAEELNDYFEVGVVVTSDRTKAEMLKETRNIEAISDFSDLKDFKDKVDFLVLCLPSDIMPDVVKKATDMGFYVLAETFALKNVEALSDYYRSIKNPDLIQVAEQYWLRPMNQARLDIISKGLIGDVTQAQVSIGHGYHGISLLRKYLNIRYEKCKIKAWSFKNDIISGPGRGGYPDSEEVIKDCQEVALFEFGNKWGIYDFTGEQYFSRIRDCRILLRGERGEIDNSYIRYLKDFRTPIQLPFERFDSGKDGSMGGPVLESVSVGDEQAYENPYNMARLSDDELAVAHALEKMGSYVKTGHSFYSFGEGCQDQYLDILMKESMRTGKTVKSKPQIWQK